MKDYNEKLMKIFWLRPAFQRNNSFSKIWRSSKYKITFISSLILLVSLLIFSAYWVDLAKYSGQVSQRALQNLSNKPIIIEEYPMNCTAWDQTKTRPNNYPTEHKPSRINSSTCPEYFRWIYEDLRHWKVTGIDREMVEKGQKHAHFRLVILDGKIYVEKFRESIQSRALFSMWGFVQLLRFYPGKLPDLELMFDCDDRPVVRARDYGGPNPTGPPPLFRYCSDGESLDIVFPDWSFWGWAETNIKPWKLTLNDIIQGNKKSKWEDRVPLAYWKGNPSVAPGRGDLMKCNITQQNDFNTLLYVQDWNQESAKGYKESNLEDQCTHRYKIYMEGWAWSVSEKYILACDSPTLLITPRYYDFFIRGMVPQKHYWPIRDEDKCRSLKYAVEWGNNHTDKAQAIGEAGSQFIHEDMKMEYVYDYIFHLLNEYSKLLRFKPKIPANAVELFSESMACKEDGNWRKFMELSLEKSPSDTVSCTMPPPYNPQGFKAFVDDKIESINEVKRLEYEYWENQKKKQ